MKDHPFDRKNLQDRGQLLSRVDKYITVQQNCISAEDDREVCGGDMNSSNLN